MIGDKVGFVFPAFGMKYKKFALEKLDGYADYLDPLLQVASGIVQIDSERFKLASSSRAVSNSEDDFQKHYVCYINSCALSDFLKERGVVSNYVAGYSMGLFASLYHSGCVSFEHGLVLMHYVCKSAHEAFRNDGNFGMGVVMGLNYQEVKNLINKYCNGLEISDVTIESVIIASGKRSQLKTLFEVAEAEGSSHSRLLSVGLPYHSSMMNDAGEKIRAFLPHIEIKDPLYPIVSCVNQKVLFTAEDVKEEVAGNVVHNINWMKTMEKMLDLGVNIFIECGLSKDLCNLAKFFQGNFRAYHPRKFRRVFKGGFKP
jgi:[acyl-carrier-protein] S-malonyltransferase